MTCVEATERYPHWPGPAHPWASPAAQPGARAASIPVPLGQDSTAPRPWESCARKGSEATPASPAASMAGTEVGRGSQMPLLFPTDTGLVYQDFE